MIEIKNLSFSYNKKDLVLDDISFKFASGECVGILGKNGVGKSTLMNCVVNVLKFKKGQILLNDVDITTLKSSERAKLISYVPQELNFVSGTVYDSILIGRKPYFTYGYKESDLDAVDEVIKKLHIENIAFKNIYNLSGGERQKVAIARALVQKPKLLYLDEPTSNLDLKNQIEVLELVKDLARQENLTVLVNIHNINLALHYFETLVLLKEGRIYKVTDQNHELTSEDIKNVFDIDVDIKKAEDNKTYLLLKEKTK